MSERAAAKAETGTERIASRPLLASMEVREPARRRADGSVAVLIPVPAQAFLYGPFLRLAEGRYRLTFRCKVRMPLQGDHPVMGLEVIAQNRLLRAWRDFSANELRAGEQSVTFDVPRGLSIESGSDSPFEFRFSHFGNALLTMVDVTLHAGEPGMPAEAHPLLAPWRLLGRLRTSRRPGGVRLSPWSISRLKLGRSTGVLRLPAGTYRVELTCELTHGRSRPGPALEVAVSTRDGVALGVGRFDVQQLATGRGEFEFSLPSDYGLDSGVPRSIDLRVRHFRKASIRLDSLVMRRCSAEAGPLPEPKASRAGPTRLPARKRLLIFGNCQGNLLAEALREHPGFARRFTVTHHYMELPANLHEQGKRDLDACDMLLIQDIKEWEQYPLRDHVPEHLPTLRYPCVRFASPWPFDAFNGPDDKLARNRDFPNFEFTYFDGLLGRLRREIPDHEQRFRAYESLQIERIVDFERLHAFEQTRLEAMDRKFATGIGSYVLENFTGRQVFYTTAHPNGRIMRMLLKHVTRELALSLRFWLPDSLDSLRRLQVPVHPKVAAALGVRWAGPGRRYLVRGEWLTWEDYFRRYIAYYG